MKTGGPITVSIEFVTRAVGGQAYSLAEIRVLVFWWANGTRVEHGLN